MTKRINGYYWVRTNAFPDAWQIMLYNGPDENNEDQKGEWMVHGIEWPTYFDEDMAEIDESPLVHDGVEMVIEAHYNDDDSCLCCEGKHRYATTLRDIQGNVCSADDLVRKLTRHLPSGTVVKLSVVHQREQK